VRDIEYKTFPIRIQSECYAWVYTRSVVRWVVEGENVCCLGLVRAGCVEALRGGGGRVDYVERPEASGAMPGIADAQIANEPGNRNLGSLSDHEAARGYYA